MTYFDPANYDPPKRHVCVPPVPNPDAPKGWRCVCGKAWRLTLRPTGAGPTVYQWEHMPQADQTVPR